MTARPGRIVYEGVKTELSRCNAICSTHKSRDTETETGAPQDDADVTPYTKMSHSGKPLACIFMRSGVALTGSSEYNGAGFTHLHS